MKPPGLPSFEKCDNPLKRPVVDFDRGRPIRGEIVFYNQGRICPSAAVISENPDPRNFPAGYACFHRLGRVGKWFVAEVEPWLACLLQVRCGERRALDPVQARQPRARVLP